MNGAHRVASWIGTLLLLTGCSFPIVAPADDGALAVEERVGLRHLAEGYAAFRHVGDPALDLPEGEVDSLYAALVHVQAYEGPEDWESGRAHLLENSVGSSDSLDRFARGISIRTESDDGWWDAWERGERFTGREDVDALIERYGLTVEESRHWYSLDGWTFWLAGPEPVNTSAIAREWEGIEGVSSVSPDPEWTAHAWGNALHFGDYNALRIDVDGESLVVDYGFGWGDCPAGCIDYHRWRFRVSTSGAVALIESLGDPVSEW